MVPSDGARPHPKAIGDTSEAMVIARLVQAGKMVLLPFGENQRYDLVLDEGTEFVRVQCKTGKLRQGAILFNTCSVAYQRKDLGFRAYHVDYIGAADLFGVYCPETDAVYLVPVNEVGNRAGTLRVEPTRNGQAKKIRWAKDYRLDAPG